MTILAETYGVHVPGSKKCCANCAHAFINPRACLKGIHGLGKYPLCTCKHPENRKVLNDPSKQTCEFFEYVVTECSFG